MTQPTRILLIEADAAARAAVATALAASRLDYSLSEAETADAGLAAAQADIYDCILLGSQLPSVDLGAYLAQLTSVEDHGQAIIVLIDDAEQENALELLRAGALDTIDRTEADSRHLARAISYAKARRGFVVELNAAREDAEAKTRALDRLNRQTTLILSLIAHDLRNPFQALLGMSEMLISSANTADAATLARRAGVVNEAAKQANVLMESLFDWANLRMDARSEPTRVPVEALFQDCARAVQEVADGKSLTVQILATNLVALGQGDAVAAILRNLAANALKFTQPGGGVTFSAEVRAGDVALCVTDTGVGMSKAQAAGLFHADRRFTSAGTAGERGAGLGLLLCRDLAEWLGGALEVESEPGQGSTFRLLLPAAGP